MPFSREPTEKQIQSIRHRWNRLQGFGPTRFVALAGTGMFLFMLLCWLGFTYALGTQRALRMSFVWAVTLPCMAFLSFLIPALWLGMIRSGARRVGEV